MRTIIIDYRRTFISDATRDEASAYPANHLCANTAVVIEMTSVFFELTPIARPSNILCTDKGNNKMTDATKLPCIWSAMCSL